MYNYTICTIKYTDLCMVVLHIYSNSEYFITIKFPDLCMVVLHIVTVHAYFITKKEPWRCMHCCVA